MIEALDQIDLGYWLGRYAVVLARTTGMFTFLPILGSEVLPIKIRVGIAGAFALVFMPLIDPIAIAPSGPVDWMLVTTRELSVGFGLGIAARMIFSGLESAASIVANQSGFAMSSMVDPASGDQALAPALFQSLLSTALFLAADLHHVFIRAVVSSYELLPSAAAMPFFGSMDRVASVLGLRLFEVAISLAGPALVVTVSMDLVMVLVGKAMPQVPILMVAYPMKLAVGLVAMAILAVGTGAALGWLGQTMARDGAMVLRALAE